MKLKFTFLMTIAALFFASCSSGPQVSGAGEVNRVEVTRLVTVEVTREISSPSTATSATNLGASQQRCTKENPCKVGDSFSYNYLGDVIGVTIVKHEASLEKLMPETFKSNLSYRDVSLLYLKMTCEEPKKESCSLIPPDHEFLNSQEVLGRGLSFMAIMSNPPNKETLNWFQMKTQAFKGTSTEGWLHYGLYNPNLNKSGTLLRFIPNNNQDPSKAQKFYFLLN